MAIDLFCWWGDRRPTAADVRTALADYLGGGGLVCIERDGDAHLAAYLVGAASAPLRRLDPAAGPARAGARGFEVFYHDTYLDVITRRPDEFTLAVATGFARLVCRYWEARYDDGSDEAAAAAGGARGPG